MNQAHFYLNDDVNFICELYDYLENLEYLTNITELIRDLTEAFNYNM